MQKDHEAASFMSVNTPGKRSQEIPLQSEPRAVKLLPPCVGGLWLCSGTRLFFLAEIAGAGCMARADNLQALVSRRHGL